MANEYDDLLRQEDNAVASTISSAAPLPAPQAASPEPVRQPTTKRNEYDELVESDVVRERSVMYNAAAKPADAFARSYELSKRTGLPADVIWRNFDQVDKHVKLMDMQRAAALSPEMRKLLSDTKIAPMAVDDLSTLESIVTGFKRGTARLSQTASTLNVIGRTLDTKALDEVERQLAAGIDPKDIDPETDQYGYRWMSPEQRAQVRANLSAKVAGSAANVVQQQSRLGELKLDKNVQAALESKTLDEFLDNFTKSPVEFIAAVSAESLPSSAPGLAASVAGGALLGPGGVALGMGANSMAVEFSSSLLEHLRKRGVNLNDAEAIKKAVSDQTLMDEVMFDARRRAAAVASFDALSGGLASRSLVGNRIANVVLQANLQGGLGALGEVAGGLAEGAPLSEMTFGEIAAEFFGEFATAPIDVAVATMATRADRQKAQVERQQEQLRRLRELSEKAVESKLRERAPESFAQLVQEAAEASGEPDAVYVDPYALNEALQQSGIDPASIAGVQAQLEDALALNAEVRIEVGEFAAKLAGTEAEAALLQHIKFDPEGLSAAEAKQQTAETLAEFDKEVESILREEGNDQASRAETEAVRARVLQQLTEANRFTTEVNEMYASLTASFYRATAARVGMSPEQLYERFPLRVAAERIDAPQLTQLDTTEENFRAWFGNSKAVDEDGAPMVMYHGTVVTTIEEFRLGGRGMIFTTPRPETARTYAGDLMPEDDPEPDATSYRPVIYPVFVKAERPFEYWNTEHLARMEAYIDGIGATGSFYTHHVRRGSWQAIEATHVQRAIKALGFDSFYTFENGSQNLAVYDPTQIKSIFNEGTFAIDDPRILKQGPTSDIGHKREKSTGRYVGAPDWVGASPAKLAHLRKILRQLAKEGEPGRFWYENSSKAILDMVGGDRVEAEKIVSLIAIYSPNATVPANTMMALTAYYQFKAGLPIKAGLGMNNRKATDLLERGEVWSGIKTNSFYQNLMVEIDPSKLDEGVATMDMWMALAFDYGMKALDQGPKYKFAERETQRLAAELGWTAHQVQAAIWTAIKGRIDPIRPALKKAELKKGIGEMVEKNGKMVYQVKPERRYDHFRLAHKMGMAYDLKPEDIIASKYDFSDALRGAQVQLSWEATPSKTKGDLPGIHLAPIEQRLEYLQAVMAALTDENGRDMIAQLSGVPQGSTVTGWSAWEGDVGAGAQTFMTAPAQGSSTKRAVKPMARELLDLHAAIMGYVLGQDAVVWHQPIYETSKESQNGIDLEFARPLTEEEFAQLYKAITDEFGTNELAPAYTPHGARVLNFVEGLSNKQFQTGLQKVIDSLPGDDFGGGITDAKAYRSDGSYIFNDWKENPNGEGYQDQIGRAGRPDLQQRAADLRARVEAVNRDFERRYGWDRSDAAGSRRDRSGPEGELSGLPGYGKPIEGSREVTGYHYSRGERNYLHSVFYGQGLAGEEASRLQNADPRLKHRVYFYLDRGEGITPEAGVGAFTHATRLRNLYDMDEDVARLKRDNRDPNAFELAVLEAGFDGYFTRNFNKSGAAVTLGERSIPTQYLGQLGTIEQTENVVPPAAPRQLDLFEQIASDNRLPIGQLSGKRWLEILTKLSPEVAQQVSSSPVFQLDQPMYKDVLARRLKGESDDALAQGTGDRGSFVPSQNLIVLLNDADLSTFLHELGHFFLHVTGELANSPEAPAELVRDMQTFLSWAGVEAGPGETRFQRWSKMSLSEQRDAHERFARGFEAYLFEDRAPSVEMRNLFRKFASWLRAVYRQLSALRVELTDEVRGVMDRMIASEDEIQLARTTRGLFAMFTDPSIGTLTSAEWEEYQELARTQTEDAIEELQGRSVREMKWLSNARAKVLRDLQKQAAAARKEVEAAQRAEMEREPIRAAETFLRHGEAWVNGEKITTDIHGLSIADLDEMYDRSIEEAPDYRSLGTGRYGMLRKDGMHPDVVAKMFGFGSGDQLVRELVDLRPFKDELADRTDAAMMEQHSELQDPAAMEQAAMASLANEARARMVAIEARALERAQRVTTGRSQGRRGGSTNLLIRAARDHAKALIGRKKIRDIRPSDHASAEAKAARQALSASKAGDLAAAAAHKRNQLVHHYASKEAAKARETVQAGLRYLRKFTAEGTRKSIDRTQLDQIDQLLERYELKAVPQRELDRRASLAEWVASQEAQGLPVSIDPDIIERAGRINYTRVTLDEFEGLVETVKNIEHLGRLKKKLLTAKDKRELQAILDEMAQSITVNARGAKRSNEPAVNFWERTKKTAREYLAMHRKVAMLGRMFDGNTDGGVFWERFIRPMNEAGDAEASMRAKATQDLMAIFQPMMEGGRLNRREVVPGTQLSLTREERLVVALNWGNETNRQRVLDGEKWTEGDVNAILGTLTDDDWIFVQQVWDYLESWWPQVNAKQQRVFGTDMGKVEGIEFRSPTGRQMRGGYYPIKYDPNRSRRAEAHTVEDLAKDMMRGAWTVQTTRRGHTKSRVNKVERPIMRDLGVIFGHTEQVIHDLAWHEWLIDATRILRDGSPVAAAIRDHYGAETLKMFEDALTDIAAGEAGARNTFEQVLNHLRTGATVAGLGWNLMTALLQPYGLTQSMVRVGPPWVMKGLATWMGDAARFENTLTMIRQRSKFMETRMLTMQREISEIRNRVKGQSAVGQFLEASFFALIARTQLIADIPTWLGAYEKAMASGNDEARATALADQAVIDAQGGGQTKDLAAIQRGSPALKLFTNFYSFFSTTYNLAVNQTRATNFRSPTDVMRLALDYLLLFTIPAVLSELMRSAITGGLDDKDEEEVAMLAAQAQLSYLLGTLVGVRELGSAVQGFYGYSGPAGLRFFGETAKLVKQATQGEADAAFFKALNNTAGIVLHYPAGQVQRTVTGVNALIEGETQNPLAILTGPPRD